MPIKHKEIDDDFKNFIDGGISGIENEIVDILVKIGEYGYKLAVRKGNYRDHTGNLRSSIGYGVVKYGRLVKSGGFKVFVSGADGVEMGKRALDSEVGECAQDSISLVFVAGAEYAAYVEVIGKDVLTFSELECYRKAEEMINRLFK